MTAARIITEAGLSCLVLEKSKAYGGRMATRFIGHSRVDTGAQYFTVHDDGFREFVEELRAQGLVVEWGRGFHVYENETLTPPSDDRDTVFACPDGMNSVGKWLGRFLNVRLITRVTDLAPSGDSGWAVRTEDRRVFSGRALALAVPAPQAANLLQPVDDDVATQAYEDIESILFYPCLSLQLGYPAELTPDWKGILVPDSAAPLTWVGNDSSKRRGATELGLSVAGGPHWSDDHFDNPPLEIRDFMVESLAVMVGEWVRRYEWWSLMKWRFARPVEVYREPFWLETKRRLLGLCGDWCVEARIEGAYRSGRALGESLVEVLK